jgi:hypothetical protein
VEKGEPLSPGSEVDWDAALTLALARRNSERDRLDRIEGKVAPIIAGTFAGLAIFFDKPQSSADYLVSALLLIPLFMLLRTFRTYVYMDVPDLDELALKYEWYPKTYVRSVVLGTAKVVAKNAPIIDQKARDLNRAMVFLFIIVAVVLSWRTYEAVDHERLPNQSITAPRATAVSTNAGNGNSLRERGRISH